MGKKEITWNSPKEYQTNHIPRKIHKVKPKQFCKPLKGERDMQEVDREIFKKPLFSKYAGFVHLRCTACGHKEMETIESQTKET